MARTNNLTNFLEDIASAIRTKKGLQPTDKISASQFDTEIGSISTATIQTNKNATPDTIEQVITPDQGYDAMAQVTIAPAVMSTEDYDTCIDLADYIMYGGEAPLPYVELEYIQSSGTQWINTGLTPNANITTEASYIPTAKGWGRVIGTEEEDCKYEMAIDYAGMDRLRVQINFNRNPYFISSISTSEFNKVKLTGDGKIYFNDTLVFDYEDSYTGNKQIQIFNGFNSKGKLKLEYCKIWDGENLVRNYIPVKRISDDVICLYDKISKTFFVNAGTGVFTAGPEKGVDE